MEYIECTGKTVEDAVQEACIKLSSTRENVEYEIIEKESSGFLGLIGGKPARIKAWAKKVVSLEDVAKDFIKDVCNAMNIAVVVDINVNYEEKIMEINLSGEEMGVLIGKRGQTIDSLQYLVSLVVNKESEEYYRIKLDTENYRERRKQTLENLAKNIAYKVKRTKRSVSLEPMNPYERRVIHSALQNDRYVTTKSEGEEPYRHVVVMLKK